MQADQPRVAMVISRFTPSVGGTERQALLLSQRLARQGVAVSVLTHRYSAELPRQEMIEGVSVFRLGTPGRSFLGSLTFFLAALRFLFRSGKNFNLIHAHMIASPAVVAAIAGLFCGRKSLVKVACSGPFGDVATAERRWFGRMKLKTVLKNINRVVCISDETEAEIKKAGAPPQKIARIPNGVDTQKYSPSSLEEKPQLQKALGLPAGRCLLFASRLTRQKRPELLLEVFCRASGRWSDSYLLFLGDGPERSALESSAQDLKSRGRVFWKGNQSDMAAHYRCAELFILPSDAEGLSNSLLEAMSCGAVCIASRVGGSSDLIEHGRNGFLFPAGDAQALERCIDDALSGKFDLGALAHAARQTVVEKYSFESVLDRYRELYQSLLKAEG
jgi:glycosyltransferase involved in cell wall biosynthesis